MTAGAMESSVTDIMLKDATASALSVGKQEHVAAALGKAQSVISDWCNLDKPLPKLSLVPHIEHLGRSKPGWPHITRALARMQGFELFHLPEIESDAANWLTQVGALSTEVAEITTKICTAVADDGAVCRQDIRKHALIDDAEQLVGLAVQLLAQLRAEAE